MSDAPVWPVPQTLGGDGAPSPRMTAPGSTSEHDRRVAGRRDGAGVHTEPDWTRLWAAVAQRIAAHGRAGRTHLLTEDVLRFETVLALEGFGITPDRVAVEVPGASAIGGRLDLVVDGLAGAVVELKFPRDSRTGISPDTMTFGELLRDFLRVAVAPAAERWVVQLLNDRLARYVAAACQRSGLSWSGAPGQQVRLPGAAVAALPRTATQAIGAALVAGMVTAECVTAEPAGDQLTLYAYRVQGMTDGASGTLAADPAVTTPEPPNSAGAPAEVSAATREGARREILAAAQAVTSRSGRAEFTMPEVIAEMRRRGTGYAEATVRTMISAHLCAESTGDGVAGYADLTRVGRGLYRRIQAQDL